MWVFWGGGGGRLGVMGGACFRSDHTSSALRTLQYSVGSAFPELSPILVLTRSPPAVHPDVAFSPKCSSLFRRRFPGTSAFSNVAGGCLGERWICYLGNK